MKGIEGTQNLAILVAPHKITQNRTANIIITVHCSPLSQCFTLKEFPTIPSKLSSLLFNFICLKENPSPLNKAHLHLLMLFEVIYKLMQKFMISKIIRAERKIERKET
jgi:hypothetical protein